MAVQPAVVVLELDEKRYTRLLANLNSSDPFGVQHVTRGGIFQVRAKQCKPCATQHAVRVQWPVMVGVSTACHEAMNTGTSGAEVSKAAALIAAAEDHFRGPPGGVRPERRLRRVRRPAGRAAR